MRISTYALSTKYKNANFAIDWTGLANSFKNKLPATGTGAAKLGASVGAGVGALNYLGSEDKSIGNLATQVGGGAAVGGGVVKGGMMANNVWKNRVQTNQKLLPTSPVVNQPIPSVQTQLPANVPNAPQLMPAAATQAQNPAQPKSYANGSSGQPIVTPAPNSNNSSAIVLAGGNQSGNSRPQNPINTSTNGAVERQNQKVRGVDNSGRGNKSASVQKPDGTVRGILTPAQLTQQKRNQRLFLESKGVKSVNELNPQDREFYLEFTKNTSPFANFKLRRYNGFIY